jgi:flagellin-like protein
MAQSDSDARETGRPTASFTDHRAISPVIGVVMLVGVTVILAAIIGTFALGIAGDAVTQQTPTADLTFAETDDGVTITHGGGDTLDSGTAEVVYTNQTGSTVRETWQTPVEAGDSPETSPFDAKAGSEIRVVWRAPDGGESYVLDSHRVSE